IYRKSIKKTIKAVTIWVEKRAETPQKREEWMEPGSHSRELNPYYKGGGSGLPLQESSSSVSKSLEKFNKLLDEAEGKTTESESIQNNASEKISRECRNFRRD
ncbi:hypothetical protein Avbf_04600, partial [Armadillidium vulgare]